MASRMMQMSRKMSTLARAVYEPQKLNDAGHVGSRGAVWSQGMIMVPVDDARGAMSCKRSQWQHQLWQSNHENSHSNNKKMQQSIHANDNNREQQAMLILLLCPGWSKWLPRMTRRRAYTTGKPKELPELPILLIEWAAHMASPKSLEFMHQELFWKSDLCPSNDHELGF